MHPEPYRTLAEFAFDWEYWLGPHRQLLYCSSACEPITGYRPQEFERHPTLMLEIVHPDDRPLVAAHLDDTLHIETPPCELQFRIITRSGDVRWLSHGCRSVVDEHGTVLGRRGSNRDITAFKDAAANQERLLAALRDTEERFRIAAETANDAVYEWDLRQRVEWPGRIDELLGYAPGEFPRTLDGWAAAVHPDDRDRVMDAVEAHLERRVPYATEYRIRRKDGTYRWWSARGAVARTPDGTPVRWIGSVTDITDHKQEIARSSLLAAIVESSDLCIIGKDLNGTVTSWNKGAEELFGYSAAEMVGTPIMRLIPADRQDEEHHILHQIRNGGRVEHLETVRLTRDGRLIDISLTVSPIKEASGQIVGVSKVARDISERKRAEAEREQLIKELRAAVEQIRTLKGILPICASCKKIRDDQGYWQQVEAYVSAHSWAQFSHGLCPDCIRRLYPDFPPDATSG